ncbi:MAG TPA: CPBP family intramembrane metalloprotease [bacterium]|nr:CPBP family intramembrane metalloprotease [bacterium]
MQQNEMNDSRTAPPPSFYGPWATLGLTALLFIIPSLFFIFLMLAPYFLGLTKNWFDANQYLLQHRVYLTWVSSGLTLLALFLMLCMIQWKKWSLREYLVMHHVRWRTTLLWIIPPLMLLFFYGWLIMHFELKITRYMSNHPQLSTVGALHASFWRLSILGPILEDLLFWGFCYRGLEQTRLGSHGAVWLLGVIFAAAHTPTNATAILGFFPLSVYKGYMRRQTGSTLPGMLHHMLHNMIIFLAFAAVQWGAIG